MVGNLITVAQEHIYNIIISIVILLLGFGLGMMVKKVSLKVLKEVGLNHIMAKVNVTYNLERWVSSIFSYVIYLFTIVIFLEQLRLTSVVLYLFVGAILMLLILTSLVGLKDVIPNFVGWLMIQNRNNFKEGYHIGIREIEGVIEKVGYLETEIKTERGDVLYVPNSLFLQSKFRMKKK